MCSRIGGRRDCPSSPRTSLGTAELVCGVASPVSGSFSRGDIPAVGGLKSVAFSVAPIISRQSTLFFGHWTRKNDSNIRRTYKLPDSFIFCCAYGCSDSYWKRWCRKIAASPGRFQSVTPESGFGLNIGQRFSRNFASGRRLCTQGRGAGNV